MKQQSFDIDKPNLRINASCRIEIHPIEGNKTTIQVEGDVDVYPDGREISITQKDIPSSGGNVVIGNVHQSVISGRGNVVISGNGQNVSMVNGRVFINGQEVTANNQPSTPYVEPKVTIYTNKCGKLTANMIGGYLLLAVKTDTATLKFSGSVEANLRSVTNIDAKTSGSSEVIAHMTGGILQIKAAGSSEFDISGEFSSSEINCSGSTKINYHK